jgi:hypothetical protein
MATWDDDDDHSAQDAADGKWQPQLQPLQDWRRPVGRRSKVLIYFGQIAFKILQLNLNLNKIYKFV